MPPRTAVLIGRFQPPHLAHLALIREALDQAPDLVIVLGSARSARTVRNPLSDDERAELLTAAMQDQDTDLRRVRLEFVPDAFYNLPLWVRTVKQQVGLDISRNVTLHGFEKDASSFYLRLFPDWRLSPPDFESGLNATDLREAMYRGDWNEVARGVTPQVLSGLRRFAVTPEFAGLLADREAIGTLASQGPIRTAAVLLVSDGQMLLTRRTERPGLGLLALPEAGSAEAATRQVLARLPDDAQRLGERLLNNPQRLPGLDWQTRAELYRLPQRPSPLPGAEWVELEAAQTQPETFFADHAQGVRALLEDWPS